MVIKNDVTIMIIVMIINSNNKTIMIMIQQ